MAKANIVSDYDWTTIPRGSCLRKKAPRVWVRSYKIVKNQAINRLKSYLEVPKLQDADTFYNDLYGKIVEQEDDFNFPYFGDNIRSFTNTFGDTFQNGFGDGGGIGTAADALAQQALGLGAQIYGAVGEQATNEAIAIASSKNLNFWQKIEGVSKALGAGALEGGNPGSYIETPKMYQYEQNDGPLEVAFILLNTENSDFSKNHNLVKRLTEICRPFRRNSIAMDPPRIFQVKLYGQRFIKWANCSNFNVNMLGTKREIEGIITPEAYMISMSFTSLTVEASNFLDKV